MEKAQTTITRNSSISIGLVVVIVSLIVGFVVYIKDAEGEQKRFSATQDALAGTVEAIRVDYAPRKEVEAIKEDYVPRKEIELQYKNINDKLNYLVGEKFKK